MVGLVIVSHSAQLAAGVAELVRGMAGSDVQIAAAGGLDLADKPLGTDVNLIQRAIKQVYSDDGVVVLVDLGSAILATEMALEMFPPAQRARIMLAPAALVEGGIAAGVQARLGSDIHTVVQEARAAFDAKLAQMDAPQMDAPQTISASPNANPLPDESALRLELVIKNPLGLHARPAARFVQTAARFSAQVYVQNLSAPRGPVNAKSISAVATLGALQNHRIAITASGADAKAALAALQQLADENFGDVEPAAASANETPQTLAAPTANEIRGRAAAPGIARGPARLYRSALGPLPENKIDDAPREWARLQAAIEKAQTQLRGARAALEARGAKNQAEIFDAQILMLQDDALQEPARRAIFQDRQNAARALHDASEQIAAGFDALDDEYQRARAADVRAVTHQVLLHLLDAAPPSSLERGILIAPDLTPAETATLDPQTIQALALAYGGPTSHSAILAKSLNIPAVVALGDRILTIDNGTMLIADGDNGSVLVNPDAAQLQAYDARVQGARAAAGRADRARHQAATTQDGHNIEIAANIGSLSDAQRAVELGAESVGLFRTEFLFLERQDAPSEEEQYETYRAVARALDGRALVLRTLDVGGDKPLPYVALPREANPFLGLRGLRLCLAQPELFKTQLRAILGVANEFPVRVMFPMVSTWQEFYDAQNLLDQARAELRARQIRVPDHLETGIMVEVPAAALLATQFAPAVDFFSIGTNDLTQYTLAAERGNPHVAALTETMQPAVLQLIALVVQAAHARKKWVGVCGEMAGDPRAIPLLVGLGVDELSMSPPLIPHAKEIVRGLNFVAAQAQAQRALE